MIRSKLIPLILAAFCGLAMQFQASRANADAAWYQGSTLGSGYGICNDAGYCFWMLSGETTAGTAAWEDPYGNILMQTPPPAAEYTTDSWLIFQNDGNLVVYDQYCFIWCNNTVDWATNTYAGNTSTGYPAGTLILADDGNLYMLDIYGTFILCIYCQ
jgi:hypothetical protein